MNASHAVLIAVIVALGVTLYLEHRPEVTVVVVQAPTPQAAMPKEQEPTSDDDDMTTFGVLMPEQRLCWKAVTTERSHDAVMRNLVRFARKNATTWKAVDRCPPEPLGSCSNGFSDDDVPWGDAIVTINAYDEAGAEYMRMLCVGNPDGSGPLWHNGRML